MLIRVRRTVETPAVYAHMRVYVGGPFRLRLARATYLHQRDGVVCSLLYGC